MVKILQGSANCHAFVWCTVQSLNTNISHIWGVVQSLMITLLQICCWVCQWKSVNIWQNMDKNMLSPYLAHVY